MELRQVIAQFNTAGTLASVVPYGNGHINDTYRVFTKEAESPDYLLQRINHSVFPDVKGLMENMASVTLHMKTQGAPHVATLIPTLQGAWYCQNSQGYWRMMEFLEGAEAFERAQNPAHAWQAGAVLADFHGRLASYPVEQLDIVIPHFHDMAWRMEQFDLALKQAPHDRKSLCRDEIDRVQAIGPEMVQVFGAFGQVSPLRVAHNDTKFNNFLFSSTHQGLCLVDLDTVMPGYVQYDVGDLVRTATVSADEDEPDLAKVRVDLRTYQACIQGYLAGMQKQLKPEEAALLPNAGPYMAFIMGLRFLTDYLSGDTYFKTKHQHHNLDRARCQLHVCHLLKSQELAVRQVI